MKLATRPGSDYAKLAQREGNNAQAKLLAKMHNEFGVFLTWRRKQEIDGIFVLPLPPNLANAPGSSGQWYNKRELHKAYISHLDILLSQNLMPPKPDVAPDKANLSGAMVLWAEMDEDNALNRMKWPQDWLVKRGYLLDDKRKHCRWPKQPAQIVSHKMQLRLEIQIEPVENW